MALANITLADGQGTPVNHVFTYNSEVPIATYSDKVGGIQIGEPRISLTQSRPSKSRASQKTQLKIEVPVLETISGDAGGYTPAPKVAYTMLFEGHWVAPDRSTTAQRKDLYAFVKNCVGTALLKGMIEDNAPVA